MTSKWLRGVLGGTALVVLLSAVPVLAQKDKGKTIFVVFPDAKKEWRWHYKAANNAILATPGEGYKAKADAMKAIETLKNNVDKMDVEFYEGTKKEHLWRLKAKNGKIMAVSSEGYKKKADAEHGFDLFKKGAKAAKVVEEKKDK
jgi:uncharacterized protein YegP (UPF0339 family)